MPSFDVVSEIDKHELSNAIDQTAREIATRFDFKGTAANIKLEDKQIVISGDNDFQLDQISTILYQRLSKRGVDIKCLKEEEIRQTGKIAFQNIVVQQGIDKDLGRKIVKLTKDSKLKVQAAMQGDQVRITGKKRDDLQLIMSQLRQQEYDLPLQFVNFRD